MDIKFAKKDDHEAEMARAQLYKLAKYSAKLFNMIEEGEELEGWVQSKLTKASDYVSAVYHHLEYEKIAKSQIDTGPREFEESLQESIRTSLAEKWSEKYKRSIDCNNPKGFSQKAHCADRKK